MSETQEFNEAEFTAVRQQFSLNMTGNDAVITDNVTGSYYVCQNCSKTFPTEAAVDQHLSLDECNANVDGSYAITISVPKDISKETSKDIINKVKKMYECSNCKVLCPTMEDLASHMSEHEEKVVVVRDSGKEHLSRVGFKCTICHKVLGSKGNLVKHQVIHTGVKPFKCSFCEKEFSIKGNRDKHELIHTNTRNFRCEVCGKEFTLKGNLQQHVLTHSTMKFFRCGICSKEFTLKGNLDKHVKRHAAGLLKNGPSVLKKSKYKNPYDSSKTAVVNPPRTSSETSILLRDSLPSKFEMPINDISINSVKDSLDTIAGTSHNVNEQSSITLNVNRSESITGVQVTMLNGRSADSNLERNEYDTYVQNL